MPSTRMSGAVAVPPPPYMPSKSPELQHFVICHLLIAKIVIAAVVMSDLVTRGSSHTEDCSQFVTRITEVRWLASLLSRDHVHQHRSRCCHYTAEHSTWYFPAFQSNTNLWEEYCALVEVTAHNAYSECLLKLQHTMHAVNACWSYSTQCIQWMLVEVTAHNAYSECLLKLQHTMHTVNACWSYSTQCIQWMLVEVTAHNAYSECLLKLQHTMHTVNASHHWNYSTSVY